RRRRSKLHSRRLTDEIPVPTGGHKKAERGRAATKGIQNPEFRIQEAGGRRQEAGGVCPSNPRKNERIINTVVRPSQGRWIGLVTLVLLCGSPSIRVLIIQE